LKQRFAQLGLVGQLLLQIGIFRFQIVEHVRCIATFQPLVWILAVIDSGNRG